MSECGACQNYCGDCEEEIDRLRAELAEVYDHRDLLMGRRDAAEAAIARVRELCGADPFAQEHGVLDDEEPAIYRWIPERYVLRALDGAE